MKKTPILFAILIVTVLLFSCGNSSENAADPDSQVTAPGDPQPVEDLVARIALHFEYVTAGGEKESVAPYVATEPDLAGKGIWVAYREEDGKLKPVLIVGDEAIAADLDARHLTALKLVIVSTDQEGTRQFERVLFRKDMVLGMTEPDVANTYAIFINRAFISVGDGQDVTRPEDGDAAALKRTRGLALAYAAQSDSFTRRMAAAFAVEPVFAVPRIVIAAEEWMAIEVDQAASASSGGGLFGFDLAAEMDGDQGAPEKKRFTTYSIDVLRDDVEATGRDPVAFQTARSLRNDILEGEVIYAATGGARRVLTASIVFSQLMSNREQFGTDNKVLTVDADHPEILDQCTDLYPEAKEIISSFLAENPAWIVQIPWKPVLFLHDREPVYGMYAWFCVQPETGRMVGMLPDGLHGASDEAHAIREALKREAIERATDYAKEKIQEYTGKEGGLHMFFGAVAGMYVASAGVLDGVGITIENPAIAALGHDEWIKFITQHSLQFCKKFLEENSDVYGYSARVGYWGGVMAVLGNLGGADAAKAVASEAWNDIKNKAEEDIRNAIEDKANEHLGQGREALEGFAVENAGRYAEDAQRFVDAAHWAENAYDFHSEVTGSDLYQELQPHVTAMVDDAMNGE